MIAKGDTSVSEPIGLKIEEFTLSNSFKLIRDSKVLYADSSELEYPLTLRKWQEGDWFIPLGMNGKKKVSDFFIDNKFSLIDKEETWLLCSGNNIIWIVGYRIDDRYKMTDSTMNAIKIEIT